MFGEENLPHIDPLSRGELTDTRFLGVFCLRISSGD